MIILLSALPLKRAFSLISDTETVMLVASALTPSPSPRNPNSGEANELTNFQVLGIASAVGLVLSVVIFILASMILYRCKKKHHHQRQDNYVPLATREDGSAHIPQSLESCTSQPNENNSFSVDELMNSSSAISKESKAGGQWHRGSSIALLPSVIERHHAQENSEKVSRLDIIVCVIITSMHMSTLPSVTTAGHMRVY